MLKTKKDAVELFMFEDLNNEHMSRTAHVLTKFSLHLKEDIYKQSCICFQQTKNVT